MRRGFAWLDTGTHNDLLEAGQFVSSLEKRQGLKVACLEEIAFRKGFITRDSLYELIEKMPQNSYKEYLSSVIEN